MSPLVSVIMSVYREPAVFIKASVESIVQQTLTDLEFIIIQDDPLNEPVASLLLGYAREDRRIRYLRNEKRLGLALSLNRGLKMAKGRYIARMDADDISLPERLQRQLGFLEQNREISLVGTSAVLIDSEGRTLDYFANPVDFKSLKVCFLKGATPCIHPTWFFGEELLKILGGYRNLPVGQDYDFLARLLASGLKMSNLNEFLVKYRDHVGRTRYRENILQIRFGEYIRRGLERGLIRDKSYFSEEIIRSLSRVPPVLNYLHRLSQGLSRKGRTFKRKNKLIFGSLVLCSGLVSPFQMYCLITETRRHIKYKK